MSVPTCAAKSQGPAATTGSGPGRRSSSWLKLKPARRLVGVIIGWRPGVADVQSLLVAGPCQGRLRYLARLRTGFTDAERRRVAGILAAVRGRLPARKSKNIIRAEMNEGAL